MLPPIASQCPPPENEGGGAAATESSTAFKKACNFVVHDSIK